METVEIKTKPRIITILFGFPFFAVGIWMVFMSLSNIIDGSAMKSWIPVEAVLTSAKLKTNTGGDSTTYQATASYIYYHNGRNYNGDKVSLSKGSDNIGSFQEDWGRKLEHDYSNKKPITIYIDPDNPSESIIDRDIRWGMVGFYFVFVIVFGGVGGGLIVFSFSSAGGIITNADEPIFKEKPWLLNKNWHGNEIKSDAKMILYVSWFMAIMWNIVSDYLPFVIYEESIKNGNHMVWIAALFPLIGVGLLIWAVKTTLKWRKLGPSPLILSPFPGELGGAVAGYIETNIPYRGDLNFLITLQNIYSYTSGSGKSRSTHEDVKWSKELTPDIDYGRSGCRLSFKFDDIPSDLKPSDADLASRGHYLWKVKLQSADEGIHMDRSYKIPVYRF